MVNVPTAANLKSRYPEFDAVTDARINAFIAEASRRVDDSWVETDQSPAIMALAAHFMVAEGLIVIGVGGTGSGAITASSGDKFLQSRKVGDVSNTWAESSASAAVGQNAKTVTEADYSSTVYGRRFRELLRLNHAGVRVI